MSPTKVTGPGSEDEPRPGWPSPRRAPGPLAGVRVVELASIGPGPFGCMVLADLGADVVRVERVPAAGRPGQGPGRDVLRRGRRSVCVELGDARGRAVVRALAAHADVVVEGFRSGVAERLGVGPETLCAADPRLVYVRMTGWGQEGPLAAEPGHDINYIAVAGALEAIGRSGEAPVPPLNLVGDNGGGGMLLAVGVLAALVERATSGLGQVVDAAMVDGAGLLSTNFYGFVAEGHWDPGRGANVCTGAPFYDTYETAGGGYVAVGAQEPKFYAAFMAGLGFDPDTLPPQDDRSTWPSLKAQVAARLATRTRDEWVAAFAGTGACVSPVLSFTEAPADRHAQARGSFVEVGGVVQPSPAPRFSRSAPGVPAPPPPLGADTPEMLGALGMGAGEASALRHDGVVWWPTAAGDLG